MKRLINSVVVISGLLVPLVAFADPADCLKEAATFVNGKKGSKFSTATFIGPNTEGKPLKIGHPCTGASCELAYFALTASTIETSTGYVPADSYGTPGKPEWHKMPITQGSRCDGVHMLVFKLANGEDAQSSQGPGKEKVVAPNPYSARAARFQTDTKNALVAFHEERQATLLGPGTGTPQGLEDAAAETLQILGQIVADRASAEAYRLVKIRLESLLRCPPIPNDVQSAENPPAPPVAPKPPLTSKDKLTIPTFPATCRVLRPLRMEDIATSRDALLGAISQDGLAYLQNLQKSLTPGETAAEEIGAATVIGAVVIPLIVRPKLLADSVQARTIVGALESLVDKHYDDASLENNRALHAIAAGVLAYTRCANEAAAKPATTVADCNFSAYADSYAGNDSETRAAARALASQLISIATLNGPQGQPDALQRVIHAVDTLFAASCMLIENPGPPTSQPTAPSPLNSQPQTAPKALEFKCPDTPEQIDLKNIPPTAWLSFAQPIVDAALERDSNALVASIAHALDVFASAEYANDHQRAFLLLASLIQYSATYTVQNSGNAEQLHEQRTKILESLTSSMSDRTARDGDDIWSFGGSLRLVAGIRVGNASPALLSPLGLPLGFGFDHVANGSAGGFHLEFSPVDLGQYISYDNNKTVITKPKVADAIAPSMTIGVGWGRSMPLVLGATAGYSPTFRLDPNKDTKGTFNAGITLGIYVPLVDMN